MRVHSCGGSQLGIGWSLGGVVGGVGGGGHSGRLRDECLQAEQIHVREAGGLGLAIAAGWRGSREGGYGECGVPSLHRPDGGRLERAGLHGSGGYALVQA